MKVWISILFSCSIIHLCSQTTIEGKIIDGASRHNLIGANINAGSFITTSDYEGKFLFNVDTLPIELTFSYLGYSSVTKIINSSEDIIIELFLSDHVLNLTTISASRYEQNLFESVVSVDILESRLINNVNAIDIDVALDKVPGVQMIDGQANIRGGSGYSYGAGSRVMLLLDDIPALQVDAGFPNWSDMPVEAIDQVEIIKGASSSLYGSSALNGIINMRTISSTSTPRTTIASAYTRYGNVQDGTQQWWSDTIPYQINTSILHTQKIGKLDIVFGGFYTKLRSYNKFTFENRKRAFLKLQHPIGANMLFKINSLINKGDNGSFFVWKNDTTGIYEPALDNPSTSKNTRYFIDPSIQFQDNIGNIFKLLTRYHRVINNNDDNQSNSSKTYYTEFQYQREITSLQVAFISGLVGQFSNTDSELFGDTLIKADNYSAYLQIEKDFFRKLTVNGGLRYEYVKHTSPKEFGNIILAKEEVSEAKLITRIGANYEITPYSNIRISWGQGYRFPTITERFIQTNFSGFEIFPNPTLQSEYGWSGELGIKQGIMIGDLKGFVDIAFYTSEYENMTEFTFGVDGRFGFSSENISDTRISGFDFGVYLNGKIGNSELSIYGGYTFVEPVYKNFFTDSLLLAGLSTERNVLKYRSAHSVKMDIELSIKSWSIGGALVYNSHMVNIDKPFENFQFVGSSGNIVSFGDIFGIKSFRDRNNTGFGRVDLRTSFSFSEFKLHFLVNNIGNIQYTNRPGLLEAPRNFVIRLDYSLNWK